MNNIIIITLAALCMHTTAFAAQPKAHCKPQKALGMHIVNITNLHTDQIEQIMLGNQPQLIVEFTQGTLIPINFLLQGDLLQLADGKYGVLEVQQTFYVRCNKKQFLFSSDLYQWKTPLQFITGNISATFTNENGQPQVKVASETDLRT